MKDKSESRDERVDTENSAKHPMRAEEINRREEHKKMRKSYFELDELMVDHDIFTRRILPKVSQSTMILISLVSSSRDNLSLGQLLFKEDKNASMKREGDPVLNYESRVHVQDIYDLQGQLYSVIERDFRKVSGQRPNFKGLFSIFVNKLSEDNKSIQFSSLYHILSSSDKIPANLKDNESYKFALKDSTKMLLNHIAQSMLKEGKHK